MFDLPEELQIAWDILQEGNIPENEELIEYCYSLLSLINGCKHADNLYSINSTMTSCIIYRLNSCATLTFSSREYLYGTELFYAFDSSTIVNLNYTYRKTVQPANFIKTCTFNKD